MAAAPRGLCLECQPFNRASSALPVKQSQQTPGQSPQPVLSFLWEIKSHSLVWVSPFEALWLPLVSASTSCQELDLPLICCYSFQKWGHRGEQDPLSPDTPTSYPHPPSSFRFELPVPYFLLSPIQGGSKGVWVYSDRAPEGTDRKW